MKIFAWEDIENYSQLIDSSYFSNGTALTIGGFDGPHMGHQRLCLKVLEAKKKNQLLKTGVITFSLPPRSKKESNFIGEVSTLPLRLQWFEHKGFDFAVVIDFSHKFSTMIGTDFLSILDFTCNMKFLFVGQDFRCGYNGNTGIKEVKDFSNEKNISLVVIDTVSIQGIRVSSSAIREAVSQGKMKYAEQLLGRPYVIDGTNLDWTYTIRKGVYTFFVDVKAVTQVLPPEGKYNVSVLLSDMTVVETTCFCDAESLRLSVSHRAVEITVRTIDFI